MRNKKHLKIVGSALAVTFSLMILIILAKERQRRDLFPLSTTPVETIMTLLCTVKMIFALPVPGE